MSASTETSFIYIAGSRKDASLVRELATKLETEIRIQGAVKSLSVWQDARLLPGDEFQHEIMAAIDRAVLAIVLVSTGYFTSNFLLHAEIPALLERKRTTGMRIFPILVDECAWQQEEWLSGIWLAPGNGRSLDSLSTDERQEQWRKIVEDAVRLAIEGALKEDQPSPPPRSSRASGRQPPNIAPTVVQTASEEPAASRETSAPASGSKAPRAGEPSTAGSETSQSASNSEARETDKERAQILNIIKTRGYRFTENVERIIADAVSVAREANTDTVSANCLFFACGRRSRVKSQGSSSLRFFNAEIASLPKYDEAYQSYRSRREGSRQGPIEVTGVSANLLGILDMAKNIGAASRPIRTRSLVEAMFAYVPPGGTTGIREQCEWLQLDPADLLRRFREKVLKQTEDSPDEEQTASAPATPDSSQTPQGDPLVSIDADNASGQQDWLDIDPHVNAFASIMAARTVVPPLSIGLFGEWGSGKTFFMRRLRKRIATIARKAQQSGKRQRDIAFYKRIVQIEFNAWHYVEGNLWASLVEHIFANLRVQDTDDDATVKHLQQHYLERVVDKLKLAEVAKTDAERKLAVADAEISKVTKEIESIETQRRQKLDDLHKLSQTTIAEMINWDSAEWQDTKDQMRATLQDSGVSELAKTGEDLRTQFTETLDLWKRGSAVLQPLLHGPDRGWRLLNIILGLAALPALSLGLGQLTVFLHGGPLQHIVEACSFLAASGASVAGWMRRQTAWTSGWIGKAEKVNRRAEDQITKLNAEKDTEIARLKLSLDKFTQESVAAKQQKADAEHRAELARAELKAETPGQLLARFIEDRTQSNDYRKHLGLLALVRQDFKNLSSIIEEENRKLEPPNPKTDPSKLFQTLDDEKKDESVRINRIVLYIDDLDRCPPAKVVEVLQAVHLLLAFPLFVVVVGVDSRWVSRSLASNYGSLLGAEISTLKDPSDPTRFAQPVAIEPGATPDDYMEKIFQIPFWLESMKDAACARMVRGILNLPDEVTPPPTSSAERGPDPDEKPSAAGEAESSAQDQPDTGDKAGPDANPGADTNPKAETDPGANTNPGAKESETHAEEKAPEENPGNRTEEEEPEIEMSPKGLEITREEGKFITAELMPLLARSPRTLKRFLNTYRLVKAGAAHTVFLGKNGGAAPFEIVMFLLAVVTAAPALSGKFLEILSEGKSGIEGAISDIQQELVRKAASSSPLDLETALAWQRIESWLTKSQARLGPHALEDFRQWVPLIARYSFRPDSSRVGLLFRKALAPEVAPA